MPMITPLARRATFLVCWATIWLAGSSLAGDSNSLIDISPDGKQLLVANTDSGTVSIVDLKARKSLCELPAGDHPEGAAWAGNSGIGLITVYGDNVVLFIDTKKQEVTDILPVDNEPYGIVTSRDGKRAYVTHDYPGSISVIDVPAKKVIRTIPAGQGVRGIALSKDEKTAYVTEFFTGTLVAVDLEAGEVTRRWVGHSQDNLARHVVLHPKREKAYLSHIRSRVTHFDARGSIFPQITFCDLWADAKSGQDRRSIALDTYNGVYIVTNPWEAALSPDGSRLYTIYAGTDDMNVSSTIEDDYREIEPIGRARRTGKHPRAIRVSADGEEVYVYNTLDYTITVHDGDFRRTLATIPVATPAHTPEWRRGKELFQTATQPMGRARWIACSSCHPDGLTDGRVWHNPEGLRKTPNLFGLAHTHPLHWSADRDEVQDFEYTIRGKLMQGYGLAKGRLKQGGGPQDFVALEEKLAGKSKDLDALAIYTNSFAMRPSPHAAGPGKLTPEAERGKAIFFSAEAKCSTCHSGPYYTDSRLEKPYNLHDVGTGGGEDEKIGPKFDTPTLLMVYRAGPYLHDGRAKTLHEVFEKFNPDDKHGQTSHLSREELNDLVAFLKSLPYEMPPDETPNTVKDRVILTYPRPKLSPASNAGQ